MKNVPVLVDYFRKATSSEARIEGKRQKSETISVSHKLFLKVSRSVRIKNRAKNRCEKGKGITSIAQSTVEHNTLSSKQKFFATVDDKNNKAAFDKRSFHVDRMKRGERQIEK